MKKIARMLFILVLLGAPPLVAAQGNSLKIQLKDRSLELTEENLARVWSTTTPGDRLELAPYLVEFGFYYPASRPGILTLLAGSGRPLIRTYEGVARAYFESRSREGRVARLRTLRSRESDSTSTALLDFYTAMGAGPDARSLAALEGICGVAGHAKQCSLVRFKKAVLTAANGKSISAVHIKKILRAGAPFLKGKPDRPALYYSLGARLPEQLHGLGLPLEAAILADRISRGSRTSLRLRVPYYLAGAADFGSAIRYSRAHRHPAQRPLNNARLDWMILAGRYKDAVRLITSQGPASFASGEMTSYTDYWTQFKYRPEVVRLRLALLLYLAGDVKKAARGLDSLKFSGTAFNGEPEKYFARLRLAQILLRDNPDLAHKIALDISYVAQAREWPVLEYHATVLDGWAQYFRGKNYKALIAFTKSAGILRGDDWKYAAEYSRLMGTLAVRNRMRRSGNHARLITRINRLLQKRPYNEAIFTIREWMPRGTGPDFFLRQAIANQNARRDYLGSLNLLLEFARARDYFYQPGKNPGGMRGFLMSVQWTGEMRKFSYMERLYTGARGTGANAKAFARKRLPRAGYRILTRRRFKTGNMYLFNFPMGKGRALYLVHSGTSRRTYYRKVRVRRKVRGKWRTRWVRRRYRRTVRGWRVASMRLDAAGVARVLKDCSGDNSCANSVGRFRALRSIVSANAARGTRLRVMYTPDFAPNERKLLGARSVMYFHSAYGNSGRGNVPLAAVYRGAGCDSRLARALDARPRGFIDTFGIKGRGADGVWIWPARVDRAFTRGGAPRPVYLRNFQCGAAQLRFWEMDRYSSVTGPGLVIYQRRKAEPALDDAFVRYFAERGTYLIEIGSDGAAQRTIQLLNDLRRKSTRISSAALKANYAGLSSRDGFKLILPHIFD